MKVVCAWCKKIMGEKDTYDDLLVSHTICRECSIKYWGVDPEEVKERMSKNPAVSERQRKFMCAELGRFRAGKKTRTGMSERSLKDFCRKIKSKRKTKRNPFMPGELATWRRIVKETAQYLRKAGYDKDSAYVSIFNRLRGVPDELIRSSINEAYRMGKNKRRFRR